MQATYVENDEIRREILRNIPTVDVPFQMYRMFAEGAREVKVAMEPADRFGPATNDPPEIDRGDKRDWERMAWEKKRRKGVMVGGRKR